MSSSSALPPADSVGPAAAHRRARGRAYGTGCAPQALYLDVVMMDGYVGATVDDRFSFLPAAGASGTDSRARERLDELDIALIGWGDVL